VFRRKFTIPANWLGKRIWLGFGGVTAQSRVWLDGKLVPELGHSVAATGVQADLTDRLPPGEHVLTVYAGFPGVEVAKGRQDAGVGMRQNSLYCGFRAIWRGVEAVAVDPLHLAGLRIAGDPAAKSFSVTAQLSQAAPAGCALTVRVASCDAKTVHGQGRKPVTQGADSAAMAVAVPGLGTWSHRSPELAVLTVSIERDGQVVDTLIERSGLRSIAVRLSDDRQKVTQILVNGSPVFLPGDMVHTHWPGTISPSTNRDDMRRRLRGYRDAGFTFLRLHTHVGHPEMLDVCDELGLYVQSETTSVRHRTKPGDYPGESLGQQVWREAIERDRNHPSLIIMSFDNESSPFLNSKEAPNAVGLVLREGLAECMRQAYALDGWRLYSTSSRPNNVMLGPDTIGPNLPIKHEDGKWSSYPDPRWLAKHPDLIDSWHVAWVGARLEKAGLKDRWSAFGANSAALQARCVALGYQEKRLNSGYAGMEHCTVRESGSYYWGVLDDNFVPKAPSPFSDEIRATVADTAILLPTPSCAQRAVRSGAALGFAPAISHFGAEDLAGLRLELTVSGKPAAQWNDIAAGRGTVARLKAQTWTAPVVEQPVRLPLRAELRRDDTMIASQTWRLWVFPPARATKVKLNDTVGNGAHEATRKTLAGLAGGGQRTVLVTISPTAATEAITSGGRVILLAGKPKKNAEPETLPGCASDWVAARYNHPHHFTVIDPHPILAGLPHDGWAEECFYSAAGTGSLFGHTWEFTPSYGAGWSVRLDALPELTPVIATVPGQTELKPGLGTWLAVKEHKSGGRLVLCTLTLAQDDPLGAWLAGRILEWVWATP
jgi:hypothetical protein